MFASDRPEMPRCVFDFDVSAIGHIRTLWRLRLVILGPGLGYGRLDFRTDDDRPCCSSGAVLETVVWAAEPLNHPNIRRVFKVPQFSGSGNTHRPIYLLA